MPNINFSCGNIQGASYLDPAAQEKQAKLLEGRMEDYKEALDSGLIIYHPHDQGASGFMNYVAELPGKLDEMKVANAKAFVESACETLDEMSGQSSEPFEIYHLLALNQQALAERYTERAAGTEDTFFTDWAYEAYKVADHFFNVAMGISITAGSEFAGNYTKIHADQIDAKRRRLGYVDEKGSLASEDKRVKEVLDMYERMFDKLTFTNEEEAGINMARYLDTLSYTMKSADDVRKYHELARDLTAKFDNKTPAAKAAIKDTLEFYDVPLGMLPPGPPPVFGQVGIV